MPGWVRGPAWLFEPARPDGGLCEQRVPVIVGRWHARVKMRAAFPHQSGQPVAHEDPKVVPSPVPRGADASSKTWIVGINRVGPRNELADPAPWQRLTQPHAGFLANGLSDNVGKNGRIQFDSRRSFHGCRGVCEAEALVQCGELPSSLTDGHFI